VFAAFAWFERRRNCPHTRNELQLQQSLNCPKKLLDIIKHKLSSIDGIVHHPAAKMYKIARGRPLASAFKAVKVSASSSEQNGRELELELLNLS
jgi:hypothetical protein